MCLIAHVKSEAELPEEQFSTIYENNSDGFGVMFVPKKGSARNVIHIHRALPRSAVECLELYKQYKEVGVDLGMHWRWKTHGTVTKDNVHPYAVTSRKNDDPFNLVLMHNGVLSSSLWETTDKDKSDTWHFIQQWLRPKVLKYGLDLLDEPFFQEALGHVIGTGNKFLLLDERGKFTRINPKQGNETRFEGVWLSNTYSLNPTHRTPTKSGYGYSYSYGSASAPKSSAGYTGTSATTASSEKGVVAWGWPFGAEKKEAGGRNVVPFRGTEGGAQAKEKEVEEVEAKEVKPLPPSYDGEWEAMPDELRLTSFSKLSNYDSLLGLIVNHPEDVADLIVGLMKSNKIEFKGGK